MTPMKYLFAVIALIIVGGVAFFFIPKETSPISELSPAQENNTPDIATGIEHHVVLTKDGYDPEEISINVGDTIVFSTSDDYGRLHWPASNLHPSHALYSEFDPKEPIEPEDTWSFVFTKVGEWRFHDHLAPYYTGVINVQ